MGDKGRKRQKRRKEVRERERERERATWGERERAQHREARQRNSIITSLHYRTNNILVVNLWSSQE